MAEARPTPMMIQYFALKEQAQDCLLFYRMGDFFELFFEDARTAAKTLDIALTARGEHLGQPVPMCGVPVHAAEAYLARLIKAGHRVAIAEQTETPAEAKARGSKSLVERGIVRVVTAGTLTEDTLLEPRSSNILVALAPTTDGVGFAATDISTGRFETGCVPALALDAELARLNASETIIPEGSDLHGYVCDKLGFSSLEGEKRLKKQFGVSTLDGFGGLGRAELAACGGLLSYLDNAGKGTLPFLETPRRTIQSDHMAIDAATRESLELLRTTQGSRAGSLLDAVDRTVTGGGARLLANDLGSPLLNIKMIQDRQALVQFWLGDQISRERLRSRLRSLPDISRALGRLSSGRGGPRDLGQLRDGLDQARMLRETLGHMVQRPALLDAILPDMDGHGELVDQLLAALVPTPPIDVNQGGSIADGYDAALDELRSLARDGRQAMAALEAKYRNQTGISGLKIKHNNVLGYHIEVSAKNADALMAENSGFTHRQTLAGVVRFNASELHELAQKVTQAASHALAAEAAHIEELTQTAIRSSNQIALTANALARLDVSTALAERAVEGSWCCPNIVEDAVFEISGGRHPVVEDALGRVGDRFVANDCNLVPQSRLWLVTGPNMGGKSTFLRQNALIAVLAQAGSFVPAQSARLGLVDKLFSRVGASDNLARGRSTFMVEMVETAAILSQATPQSLIILDEVGRGTSTYDGLAIAWSVVEAVHEVTKCRCLFATHYHELTRLAVKLSALSLHHVRAREYRGDLVLLHEVADGPADRSYGIAVARLAGMPPAVLARAKAVLEKLEAGRDSTGGLAAGLDDLPLFATKLEAPPVDPVREFIDGLDVDSLSPRDALDQLYALKRLRVDTGS